MSVDASDNARGASSSAHNQDGDLVVVVNVTLGKNAALHSSQLYTILSTETKTKKFLFLLFYNKLSVFFRAD